jgi:hypothetical protein
MNAAMPGQAVVFSQVESNIEANLEEGLQVELSHCVQ